LLEINDFYDISISRAVNFVGQERMRRSYFCVMAVIKGITCIALSLKWKVFQKATGFASNVKIKYDLEKKIDKYLNSMK
jgi:cell division protein FtsX